MGWIIERTRVVNGKRKYEFFRDACTLDEKGTWEQKGLPMQFEKHFMALHQMYKEAEKDPEWEYGVSEYLR